MFHTPGHHTIVIATVEKYIKYTTKGGSSGLDRDIAGIKKPLSVSGALKYQLYPGAEV